MQEQKDIIDCYDKTAENYANKFINELEDKHLDQILLKTFVEQNKEKGKLIDLGCGPGQTTKFLFDNGFKNILGIDISGEMIQIASKLNPHLTFEQADMLKLNFNENSFGSAIAFYSIVHFDYQQIRNAFSEIYRILNANGEFLFSFHIGNEVLFLETFLDKQVKIKFQFFEVEKIKNIVESVGFEIIDIIQRQPYQTEHATERAYIWTRKPNKN